MGLISHLFSMAIGSYMGAFVAQNYEVSDSLPSLRSLGPFQNMPKLLPPSQINQKSIEDAAGSITTKISETLESFQIPVVPSIQNLSKQLEDYLQKFKKPEEK